MKNKENDIEYVLEKAWKAPYQHMSKDIIDESWDDFERNTLHHRPRRILYGVSLAAAILILLFSTYYFAEIYNPTILVNNYGMTDKEVNLPDGSLVLLKVGSELRYKENFDKERGVELEGEAFFNIVKDSLKEFSVKTKYTNTRVLGTSFLVNEKKDRNKTEVFLYSGSVSVDIKGIKNKSWAIIPGESFVYTSEGQTFISKFSTGLSFEAGNEFIDLNEIELEKLFKFLQNRFDYKFIKSTYTQNKLVTLRINKTDSLTEILKLLSIINNSNYEIDEPTKEVKVFNK